MGIKSNNPAISYFNFFSESGKNAMPSVPATPVTATGGTKATPGDGYVYHLFSPADPGNFVITSGNQVSIDCLIVGGGAGGSGDGGGGSNGGVVGGGANGGGAAGGGQVLLAQSLYGQLALTEKTMWISRLVHGLSDVAA